MIDMHKHMLKILTKQDFLKLFQLLEVKSYIFFVFKYLQYIIAITAYYYKI